MKLIQRATNWTVFLALLIEALAWGSNLSWGYSKHPPVSAFIVEALFSFFGNFLGLK